MPPQGLFVGLSIAPGKSRTLIVSRENSLLVLFGCYFGVNR